jgi:hypothetical protein
MAPTAKLGGAQANRFSPRGVEKWYWLDRTAVADPATITRLEIDAGTDLTPAIASVSGFTESANFTETPDLLQHRTGKILDGISQEDGSMSYYGSRDGADASTFYAVQELGYIMHLPYGDVAANKYDLFTVEVGSVSPSTATTGAKMVDVAFGLNAVARNLALPA